MKKIHVAVSGHAYDVLVEHGIAANSSTWKRSQFRSDRAFIFADSRLRMQETTFARALKSAGWKTDVVRVTASEKLKDFRRIYPFYDKLLRLGADRGCAI